MTIGLSRYRGSTWRYRPELDSLLSIDHPRLVAISRKQGQGSALDPAKAEDLWNPFISDNRDSA